LVTLINEKCLQRLYQIANVGRTVSRAVTWMRVEIISTLLLYPVSRYPITFFAGTAGYSILSNIYRIEMYFT